MPLQRYIYTVFSTVGRIVLAVITSIIVPKALGPKMLGSIAYGQIIVQNLRGLFDFNIGSTFFNLSASQHQSGGITRLFGKIIFIQIIISILILCVLCFTNSGNEISAFGGTAVNATGSMSTVTTVGALALSPGTRSGNGTTTPYSWAANGKSMVFQVSMTNLANLEISYATQRSSVAGFTTHQWDYSINGTSWTTGTTVSSIPTSFATSSLAIASGLDNAATAYVRVTFTGGTDSGANTRVDNFQFNATAIPAPGAVALIGLAGMVASRRRRN